VGGNLLSLSLKFLPTFEQLKQTLVARHGFDPGSNALSAPRQLRALLGPAFRFGRRGREVREAGTSFPEFLMAEHISLANLLS
jgi:hypothetical protein